jgi:hypothetical protein
MKARVRKCPGVPASLSQLADPPHDPPGFTRAVSSRGWIATVMQGRAASPTENVTGLDADGAKRVRAAVARQLERQSAMVAPRGRIAVDVRRPKRIRSPGSSFFQPESDRAAYDAKGRRWSILQRNRNTPRPNP